MMNDYPDPAAAAVAASAAPCCCCNDNAGKAAAVQTTGGTSSLFADMIADCSTDDLFELVWEQAEEGQTGGGSSGGGASGSMQPALSCLWSPRFSSKPPPSDVRFDPPSEGEMAAWLGTIVRGEELIACTADDADGSSRRPMADDCRRPGVVVPATTMGTSTETDKKEKVPMGTSTETGKKEKVPTTTSVGMMVMGNNKETRKAPAGGSSSRRSHSHHGEAHNLTEKRRRHKINERLKTLQQLVPGCSKSNQASTLDQTIHYMKLLQHQVQAMSSVGLAVPPVYPVVQPQCVPLGTPPVAMPFTAAPMVPFRATLLQLPHYPAASLMMMPAAAVPPLYPAPAPATSSTAVAPRDAMSDNLLHGSS